MKSKTAKIIGCIFFLAIFVRATIYLSVKWNRVGFSAVDVIAVFIGGMALWISYIYFKKFRSEAKKA